jgi:hypothetical protein
MLRHKILWVVSLLFITSFSFPNLSFSAQEQRLALLIGNSHYTHGGSLPNPVNDVRAIKKALEGLGFTVMKYEDCSQKTMKRAMDKFGRKLKDKNVGLFFYAGHGVQVNGHNYLMPVDAKLDTEHDAEYDCVRADRVLAKMEGAGSKTNIVILDACRDNPFTRSWHRGTQGTGLAFMNAPSGSLIAYSTAPGKTALDGRGENSPYTSALLQHIGSPNITVIQMFQRVRSTVRNKSGYKQTPWESTSLGGDFYFNGGSGKIGPKQPPPASPPNAKSNQYTQHQKDLFNKALGLYRKQEKAESLKVWNSYIELRKDDIEAYLYRGGCYNDTQQYVKAIQDYNKAIELSPEDSRAYGLRGDSYYRLQQYVKAIQDFDKVIDLDPKSGRAYGHRGGSYLGLNQRTQGCADLDKGCDLGDCEMLKWAIKEGYCR